MIATQPWEARAGISGDGHHFLSLWMNHNPSVSQTIYPNHRCDIDLLYLNHYHDTDRDSTDSLYRNCTIVLYFTRANTNIILLKTSLCHSAMLLLTCTHNNKNLWAFTSSCYIIYETMMKPYTIIGICQNKKMGTN